MHKMTEDNLKAAFAGESQAHMKYLAFAEQAEKKGLAEIGRLFRATSYAEQIHAHGHLRILGSVGDVVENLGAAVGGENFEVAEMYPAYIAAADAQEEKSARRSFDWALQAEKTHANLYARAKEAAQNGQDVKLGQVHVCSVCGWTGEGEPPDKCPLCGAKKEKFVLF
ncbi:MAG: rubrerythrin family protein [Chloroflexi bacterium]|nr:rubrerythrin family protein [Chloroflexota bacterium]MBU1746137.1 rubrerythrin family protein [Chloroflexota bacterium]MBU1878342.1 rubrerythrin family protein [Chloroflexota bacterium]